MLIAVGFLIHFRVLTVSCLPSLQTSSLLPMLFSCRWPHQRAQVFCERETPLASHPQIHAFTFVTSRSSPVFVHNCYLNGRAIHLPPKGYTCITNHIPFSNSPCLIIPILSCSSTASFHWFLQLGI